MTFDINQTEFVKNFQQELLEDMYNEHMMRVSV